MQNQLFDIRDANLTFFMRVILLRVNMYSICFIPSMVFSMIAWYFLGNSIEAVIWVKLKFF